MDISSPITNTLRISSKKGYILVDPDASEDAKVIILTDSATKDIQMSDDNLVIYGPGDFEVSGILIKGTKIDDETIYSIDTGEGRALLASSEITSKLSDEDDYDVVVVKALSPVDEATLASISSKLVVVYGDDKNIPEGLKAKKVGKVSLKKRDEIDGNVVYLEKK